MKFNHINLTVTDVQSVRHFFEEYFGFVSNKGTTDTSQFVGLKDEDDFLLTLMQSKEKAGITYPETFHIGFLNVGKKRTNEIYYQLKDQGYDVQPPGFYRENEFYFLTPWGFTIQVS